MQDKVPPTAPSPGRPRKPPRAAYGVGEGFPPRAPERAVFPDIRPDEQEDGAAGDRGPEGRGGATGEAKR